MAELLGGAFRRRGLYPHDVIRPTVWDDCSVDPWYAQNALLYLPEPADATILDLVHPELYVKHLEERDAAGPGRGDGEARLLGDGPGGAHTSQRRALRRFGVLRRTRRVGTGSRRATISVPLRGPGSRRSQGQRARLAVLSSAMLLSDVIPSSGSGMPDVEITGFAYDRRVVTPGTLFSRVPGLTRGRPAASRSRPSAVARRCVALSPPRPRSS